MPNCSICKNPCETKYSSYDECTYKIDKIKHLIKTQNYKLAEMKFKDLTDKYPITEYDMSYFIEELKHDGVRLRDFNVTFFTKNFRLKTLDYRVSQLLLSDSLDEKYYDIFSYDLLDIENVYSEIEKMLQFKNHIWNYYISGNNTIKLFLQLNLDWKRCIQPSILQDFVDENYNWMVSFLDETRIENVFEFLVEDSYQ